MTNKSNNCIDGVGTITVTNLDHTVVLDIIRGRGKLVQLQNSSGDDTTSHWLLRPCSTCRYINDTPQFNDRPQHETQWPHHITTDGTIEAGINFLRLCINDPRVWCVFCKRLLFKNYTNTSCRLCGNDYLHTIDHLYDIMKCYMVSTISDVEERNAMYARYSRKFSVRNLLKITGRGNRIRSNLRDRYS